MMPTRGPIRVLVIDDSALSRQLIARMLESSPLIEVVGVARDGEDALRKTLELEPDLITLDLEMPRMDGFTFLRVVMAERATPVLVISGRSRDADVFKALELGAVDFVAKPEASGGLALRGIERELLRKVLALRELRIDRVSARITGAGPPTAEGAVAGDARGPSLRPPIVVVGASTGGPAALMQLFAAFREPPACAFFVAQHMPSGFTRSFAERLDRRTAFRVREAEGGERAEPGAVLIAPGGRHLELTAGPEGTRTRLSEDSAGERCTPSVNRLFRSAAKHCGADVLAVVLTGMGDDGRDGACQIRAVGGRVIAESEETAVIYGMPKQVVLAGAANQVLSLAAIPAALTLEVAGIRGRPRARDDREGVDEPPDTADCSRPDEGESARGSR